MIVYHRNSQSSIGLTPVARFPIHDTPTQPGHLPSVMCAVSQKAEPIKTPCYIARSPPRARGHPVIKTRKKHTRRQ